MALKPYDPKKILIVFGPQVITGYAKDSFLNAGYMNDQVASEAGADGEIAVGVSNDRRGKFEFTLIQTSLSNDFLSATAELFRVTSGGFYYPIVVKDLLGTTLLAAGNAWITKPADVKRGRGIGDSTWTIETDDLEIFNGGVAPVGS